MGTESNEMFGSGSIAAFYRDCFGAADGRIRFGRRSVQSGGLADLEVLFFATAPDGLNGPARHTTLATVGMSFAQPNATSPRSELLLGVSGDHSEEDLRRLARALAELAALPARGLLTLEVPQVLRGISWPIFESMDCALLEDAGRFEERWLPTAPHPIRLLTVHPLRRAEAGFLESCDSEEEYRSYLESGVDWNDPLRPPLTQERAPSGAPRWE